MDKEIIKNLKCASEYLAVLEGMLKREKVLVNSDLEYASKAKLTINDTIYQLTGEEFYRNQSIGGAG